MERKPIKRGSVTIEAALFLPLFFVAILTVAFSMRWILYELQTTNLALDEANRVAISAYQDDWDVLSRNGIFSLNHRIITRSLEETSLEHACYVSQTAHEFLDSGLTDLIEISITYPRSIPVPFFQDYSRQGETRLLFRAFVGRSQEESFSLEDVDDDDFIVWVFPVAGERYHLEDCGFIKVCARQKILSSSLRSTYSPCQHCHPETLEDGHYVYVFPNQGSVYHRGNCFIVDRFVIAMMKSAAEERGYTPCKSCFGGTRNE
jgi:hypothetical protein